MTTISFNIATDSYKEFIERIRDWARQPGRNSHGRPVLPIPPDDIHESEYADLELKAKDNNVELTIIIKIRKHNLYIMGYKMHGAQNFLEFKWDKGTHYIKNSTPLGFGASYNDLGELEKLGKVGYETLKMAIVELARAIPRDSHKRRHLVRALAVMVPEVVRFEKMFKVLISPMKMKQDIQFEKWMIYLIRNWTSLSDMLLHEDGCGDFCLPNNLDGTPCKLTLDPNLKLSSSYGIAEHIGILKGNYHPPRNFSGWSCRFSIDYFCDGMFCNLRQSKARFGDC